MSTAPQPPAAGTYATDDQEEIDAFLREEGVPVASHLSRSDITTALVTLGYTVATASVKFVVKMALRRLDTLQCVEGELRRDAAGEEKKEPTTACKTGTSVLGWSRHLYKEDKSASAFLRGGWAEFGFVLATSVEETAVMVALRAVYGRLLRAWPGAPRSGFGWACLHVVTPMLVAGLLSWPLRAARTAVMVNYLADTTTTTTTTTADAAQAEKSVHRYTSAAAVWRRVWQSVGLRGLLRNGLDMDVAGRAVSMTLVWTVVQPATRWIRQVATMRARAEATLQVSLPDATSAAPSLLMRFGQYRYFNLAALLVVVGTVNTLQRPFVVLRQRMALMPAQDGEDEKDEAALHGCRYANGWDCVRQVVRREGVTALFAGLPLCLLTGTVVPLAATFAGFPTAPSFSGAVV